jgi:hypothetical protein
MEMSVVPNFDINWNELEQIEIDDELENTFLRLTALDECRRAHFGFSLQLDVSTRTIHTEQLGFGLHGIRTF